MENKASLEKQGIPGLRVPAQPPRTPLGSAAGGISHWKHI